jgi:hypothetical protein
VPNEHLRPKPLHVAVCRWACKVRYAPNAPRVFGSLRAQPGACYLIDQSLSAPLLANSVWPYYFLDAYVFGAVGGSDRPVRWPGEQHLIGAGVRLIASLGTLLTEYEPGASDRRMRIPEGGDMGAVQQRR